MTAVLVSSSIFPEVEFRGEKDIFIDGKELKGVRSFETIHEVDELPRVRIEFFVSKITITPKE